MKRKINVFFVVVVLTSMSLPWWGGAFNVSSTDLTNKPKFIENGSLNMNYFFEFDDYYTNSFAFRTTLIEAYNKLFEVVFNQSGNQKVIMGKEGYLYFEKTLDDYLKVNTLTSYDLERLVQVLKIQKEALDQRGIDSYLVVVPNKASVYPEYMRESLNVIGSASNLERLSTIIHSMPWIELKKPLISYKKTFDGLLYHQLDTHWNNAGAALGYSIIQEAMGKEALPFLKEQPIVRNDWTSDLALMLYPSGTHKDMQYYYPQLHSFSLKRAIRSYDDIQIETVSPDQEGRLLVYRDSFFNALIPYFSASYEAVFYHRGFPYDYNHVDVFQPNTVLIEIAERNLRWFLQQTPILISAPQDVQTQALETLKMPYEITNEKVNDKYFMNVRYTHQSEANKITQVKLSVNDKEYDAFPIYSDSDLDDGLFEFGFSLYTDEKVDERQMKVIVLQDGVWHVLVP